MPKRKLDEVNIEDGPESPSSNQDTNGTESEDSNSSVHTSSSADLPTSSAVDSVACYTQVKKKVKKKSVKFEGVTVYYFPRKQGFVCVPSQGGSTLGMSDKHLTSETFSLVEYTREQRLLHRRILRDQKAQGKLNIQNKLLQSNSSDSNHTDSDSSLDSEDDLNVDDYYFLQPVSTRQRRLLLRQSGVKKIDTLEKDDCKDIRSSREMCGCDCRVYCDPETCSCSQAGIKCQVDRLSFPCGCSKDGCSNPSGRIEFNPIRVRTHFIHTLMRLEREKMKLQEKMKKQKLRHINSDCSEADTLDNGIQGNSLENGVDDCDKTSPSEETVFNSNEMGSCCDCQQSDIGDFMIRESQLNNAAASASLEPDSGLAKDSYLSSSHDTQLMGPGGLGPSEKHMETMPHVLLFNDSDDEYQNEATAAIYPFKTGESSYSESSDCSSEGSVTHDEASSRHTYQQFHPNTASAAFSATPAGMDPNPNVCHRTISGYCIPPKMNYQPSTAPPEQKFMELNASSSGYKLEPISEILNPIRFPAYNGSGSQVWTDSYCAYSSQSQQSDLPGSLHSNSYEDSSGLTSKHYHSCSPSSQTQMSEFLYPINNSTPSSSSGNATLPCGLDNHYMEQDIVGYNGLDSFNTSLCPGEALHTVPSNTASTGDNQPSYTQLTSKDLQPTKAETRRAASEKHYQDLSSSTVSSTTSAPENSATYQDLSNAKPSNTSGYSTDTSDGLPSLSESYTLPDQQQVIAVSTSSPSSPKDTTCTDEPKGRSDSGDKPSGSESSTPSGNSQGKVKAIDCTNNAGRTTDSSTNFGEIIKESIVETVSA